MIEPEAKLLSSIVSPSFFVGAGSTTFVSKIITFQFDGMEINVSKLFRANKRGALKVS